MKILKKLFEKSDFRLVETIDVDYYVEYKPGHILWNAASPEMNRREYVYTYYLYEDQKGNRKIDVIDTQDGDLDLTKLSKDNFVFRNHIYRKRIRPWLDGAYDPEITDYKGVKRRDMLSALKGEKVK